MSDSSGPPTRTGIGTVFGPLDLPTLTDPGGTIPGSSPSSLPKVTADATPAQTGPRYEVRSILGRGGMGEVRLCRDIRIGREVAVKVAHAQITAAGSEGRSRFLREARIQAQLEHPAIVPVHEIEILDDGASYFSMKRVRGETLSSILRALKAGEPDAEKRHPLRKLLAAFNSVCLAIDFAHARGVVHRDIKPGNIMLGDFGEVYVLDWGLAKVIGIADVDVVPLEETAVGGDTVEGHVLGTPGYMAPEQVDTSLAPIGPAADVFALGATLFEILTRSPLIAPASPIEMTLETLHLDAPAPSSVAPGRGIPPELDDACRRALARLPGARFASARALHDAVDAHLAGLADIERRRALSQEHTARARKKIDEEDRPHALSELGSALALDPDNIDARRSLVRLLTSAPATPPPEVRAQLVAADAEKIRKGARLSARVGIVFTLFCLPAIFIGIREWPVLVGGLGCIIASGVVSLWSSTNERPSTARQIASIVLLTLGYACFSRALGPFVSVPPLLLGASVVVQAHPDSRVRSFTTVWCAVVFVALVLAEWTGLVAPSYEVVDGGILIREHALHLSGWSIAYIAITTTASIVSSSLFARSTRQELGLLEEKLRVQAWQLEQLVPPDGAHDDPRSAPMAPRVDSATLNA